MPDFDGLTIEIQAEEACFEVAVYNFLRWETEILASCLLYSCVPVQYQGPKLVIPRDLSGRQLFVFESSEGENDVWTDLTRCGYPPSFNSVPSPTLRNSSSFLTSWLIFMQPCFPTILLANLELNTSSTAYSSSSQISCP